MALFLKTVQIVKKFVHAPLPHVKLQHLSLALPIVNKQNDLIDVKPFIFRLLTTTAAKHFTRYLKFGVFIVKRRHSIPASHKCFAKASKCL